MDLKKNPNDAPLSCFAMADRGGGVGVLFGDDQLAQRMNVASQHRQGNVTVKTTFADIPTTN